MILTLIPNVKIEFTFRYTVEQKTNSESNSIPAKPDFEWTLSQSSSYTNNVKIKWFPCGRERNCHGKEPGTHFHVKLR